MNTPNPCDKCINLYYDPMCKDDPSYMAECKFNLILGNIKCKKFEHYRSQKSDNNVLSFGDILRKYIEQ